MLLNQCLAISLTQLTETSATSTSSAGHQNEVKSQKQVGVEAAEEARRDTQANGSNPQINHSTALSLFRQIIERNLLDLAQKQTISAECNELSEALKRIEFAGFVVPSWLLLSGTFNDLHLIKTSWANGNFRSTGNLRIETIGNIRSVNVDYFGVSSTINNKQDNTEHLQLPPVEQTRQQQQQQQQQREGDTFLRHDTGNRSSRASKYEEYRLNWLITRQKLDETLILEALKQLKSPGDDHIKFETLKWHLQQQSQAPSGRQLNSILDEQLSRLAKSNKIRVVAARESTGQGGPVDWGQASEWTNKVICLTDFEQPTSIDGDSLADQVRRDSSSSIKSKSTTLDSGICCGHSNWDQSSGSTTTATATATATTSKELNEALKFSRRQVEVGGRDEKEAERTRDTGKTANSSSNKATNRRRGFSLTRSFRPRRSTSGRLNVEGRQVNGKEETRGVSEQRRRQTNDEEYSKTMATGVVDGCPPPPLPQQQQQQQQQQRPELVSLFRSKSMRVVSVSGRFRSSSRDDSRQDGVGLTTASARPSSTERLNGLVGARQREHTRQQATIDYLAGAQTHKRTFSMRRNSLLTFGKELELGGGTNRLAHLLRKLFNIRRPSRQRPAAQADAQDGPKDANRLFVLSEPLARQVASGGCANCCRLAANLEASKANQCHCDENCRALAHANGLGVDEMNGQHSSRLTTGRRNRPHNHHHHHHHHHHQNHHHQQQQHQRHGRHHHQADGNKQNSCQSSSDLESTTTTTTTSSSSHSHRSSSPANSLIEILDCSPSMSKSRHSVREERALSASRATWRLIKRSDSSLSNESRKSCSTVKSTASQQLQRHLDEAYKRHRTCRSQRERDFIDSINVLRQASRHALQSSRSSSKSRQMKSAASSTSSPSSSAAPNDDQLTSLLINGTNPEQCQKVGHFHNEQQFEQVNYNASRLVAQELDLKSKGSASVSVSPLEVNLQSSAQQTIQSNQLILNNNNNNNNNNLLTASNGYCCPCLSSALAAPTDQQQQQQHQVSCPSLCQLVCCPNSHQSTPINQHPLPSCCLALQRLANGPETSPTSALQHHQQQQQTTLVADLPDLCCPLWRSMVSSYWQQQQQHQQPSIVDANAANVNLISPLFGTIGLPLHDQLAALSSSPMPADNALTNLLVKQQAGRELRRSQESLARQQLGLLESVYSSSSSKHKQQVQQHQHNTTIDLKIEIGADFNSLAATGGASKRNKSIRSQTGPAGHLIRVNERTIAGDGQDDTNTATAEATSGSDSLDCSTSSVSNAADDDDDADPMEGGRAGQQETEDICGQSNVIRVDVGDEVGRASSRADSLDAIAVA